MNNTATETKAEWFYVKARTMLHVRTSSGGYICEISLRNPKAEEIEKLICESVNQKLNEVK
jgi:hypothetical protein